MSFNRRHDFRGGLTWIEVILALTLVITLVVLLLLPSLLSPSRGSAIMLRMLSKMRQLQLATQEMTLDSEAANKPPNIRWTCDNGKPLAYEEWADLLVKHGYLSRKDFAQLTTSEEKAFWLTAKKVTNAITVYAVDNPDANSTLLLSSRNWRGPSVDTLVGKPYFETNGFIVFRKGGDGAILKPGDCQRMDLIGTGGKYNFLPLK